MRRDLVVAALVGAAVTSVVFAGVDAARPDSYVVTATPYSGPNQIGVTADGWTYGIPTSVAWRDARGSFHENGRPECLPPSGEEEGPVRFTAIPVEVGGATFRQVVFVECM